MSPDLKAELMAYARARIAEAVAALQPQPGNGVRVDGTRVALQPQANRPRQSPEPVVRPARTIAGYALEPTWNAVPRALGQWSYYEGQPFYVNFPPILGTEPTIAGTSIFATTRPVLRLYSNRPYVVASVIYDLASRSYTVGADTYTYGGAATIDSVAISAQTSIPANVSPAVGGIPASGPPFDITYATPGRYERHYLIATVADGLVQIEPTLSPGLSGADGWGGWHLTEDGGFYDYSGNFIPYVQPGLSVP